jgi:hypothetical protein
MPRYTKPLLVLMSVIGGGVVLPASAQQKSAHRHRKHDRIGCQFEHDHHVLIQWSANVFSRFALLPRNPPSKRTKGNHIQFDRRRLRRSGRAFS